MTDFTKFTEEQYGLYHSVIRSIRYHDRRMGFFRLLHNITSVVTIFLASSFLLASNNIDENLWLKVLSIIAALFAALDIVVGFSESANLHHTLRRKYMDLELAILSVSQTDTEAWKNLQLNSLKIEQEEPPIYRALDLLCREEVNAAEGIKPEEDEWHTELKWYQRLTAHLLKWENIAIK